MEKLKLFGTSLYDMNGVKKTLNLFEKAKLGNLPKQTGEPINRGDPRSDLDPPAIPQWLVDLRRRKEIRPMATCLQITESRRTMWPKNWGIITSWSMSLDKDV